MNLNARRTVAVAALAWVTSACDSSEVKELPSFEARAGYAIGKDVGRSLKSANVEIDFDALVQGLRDALEGREPLLDDAAALAALQEFQGVAQRSMMEAEQAKAAENRAEGEAYLAMNASAEGVVTTESGLQYKVVTEGTGPKPTPTDQVRVHYRGTFANGETFDSSYDRGEPAVFGVTQVISGWTEALMSMPVGSTYELVIPSDLAYGSNAPPAIGPDRTLLFTVELLAIEP